MRRTTIADATFYDLFCAKVATFSALLSRLPGYCFAIGKKCNLSKPLRDKVGEYITAGFDDFTKRTIYRLSMEKLLHFSQQLNNII